MFNLSLRADISDTFSDTHVMDIRKCVMVWPPSLSAGRDGRRVAAMWHIWTRDRGGKYKYLGGEDYMIRLNKTGGLG